MAFFNSKNASVTISAGQSQPHRSVSATAASTQQIVSVSDTISLATNDTVQLGGVCATTTSAPVYNFVNCNIIALVN